MAEYVIGKVVVRIHGEVDQRRIEQACLTYMANTQNKKEEPKNGKHNHH